MTNDEIDALIIAAHPTDPAKFVESGTFEYDRLIFRAGMEHAAKICCAMETWHGEYINGPLRCAAVIRAEANAPPQP